MSRLAGLDRRAGRRGAHAWVQRVRSAVLSDSYRTSLTLLLSDTSFKTSFDLDHSYASFPTMKTLCTRSKSDGIYC